MTLSPGRGRMGLMRDQQPARHLCATRTHAVGLACSVAAKKFTEALEIMEAAKE
jgi:hypothetical protein